MDCFPDPKAFCTESLRVQISQVLSDLGTDVVKTGMLATSEIVQAVADALKADAVTGLGLCRFARSFSIAFPR